ncbi:protein phosphatase 1 regulatory subunit 42-like [Ctenocephalides felis]|uniref:protein phosphatase 1 regulatory subunit 42-like n=1 Tax=Ctenocephalides felis TaxID=7515 RepID=UPI000E6E4A27|nr:protein phosphatase 1 regulatory subunit 42-like [Ctenocephalides felis]
MSQNFIESVGSKNILPHKSESNLITKLENLESLIHLEKLYIGHNKISVLEGLEHNLLLKELHIQRQILNPGSSMCFDPRTMYCLNLEVLRANDNFFPSADDFVECLQSWLYLKEAEFKRCPATKLRRYKDTIIGNSHRLEMLDGKPVSQISRVSLNKLLENQAKAKIRAKQQSHEKYQDLRKSLCEDNIETYINMNAEDFNELPNNSSYISWNSFYLSPLVPSNELPGFLRQQLRGSARTIAPKFNKY